MTRMKIVFFFIPLSQKSGITEVFEVEKQSYSNGEKKNQIIKIQNSEYAPRLPRGSQNIII